MRREIKSAVNFLGNLLRSHCGGRLPLDEQVLEQLSLQLRQVLNKHYKHHWHPEFPQRGSAYRCLRINHKLDPLIIKAGQELGIEYAKLVGLFPKELTLWIDPGEVSYRIGEDGTVCMLYESKRNREANLKQLLEKSPSSSKSSPRSSPGSSPRSSPTTHLMEMVSDNRQQNHHYNYSIHPHAPLKTCRQEAYTVKAFGQYENQPSMQYHRFSPDVRSSGSPPLPHQYIYSSGNGLQHHLPSYVVS